ncbi:TonB-dependent receptor domain-containing protein [Sphingomonas crocodyli]|uniref:TonB-dependent receptor n=1 Tax=Sphingomonas crocodyli TaxID=1979270 RepID=A0A437M6H2_9SPHN|nr:TonB-dependent receptor [Sphingomonas crocodyli]RVT93155.1 TonB-dependent receptor [Sphingomonas crocodyli]
MGFDIVTARRTRLMLGVAVASLATSAAFAQEQAAAEPAAAAEAASAAVDDTAVSEIIVTGSRISRSGFTAPTPTTVMGVQDIQKAAPANIADFVNQLPQLSGSATTRTNNANTSTGANGLNALNLRSLGTNRTLVLLDGRRVVASSTNAAVDVNNLPSALVERVDVVTGGASAAYGSDAVAGVVNFVLQKKYTGFKGSISGGITDRSDGENGNGYLAFGAPFAEGRGHVLLSVEGLYQKGIGSLDPKKRKWFNQTNLLLNPAWTATNGQPRRIIRSNVNNLTVAQGGVITTTALANTQFGDGGVPLPFERGSLISDPHMVGGNPWYETNAVALDSKLKRWAAYGRASYELTDDIEFIAEGSYSYARTGGVAAYQRYPGNLTISASNAFLPDSIRQRAAAANVSSFRYGYSTFDLGQPYNQATRETYRAVAALEGTVFDNWKWDAYYQYGQTDAAFVLSNTTNVANFARAIDAVRNSSGQIVCRSTLTNPGDGCVPLNIFGYNVASQAAINYVKGRATQDLTIKQNVAAASLSGEPFELWAGPVSLAVGAEYRKEQVSGTGDAISAVNGWFTGNFKGTNGSYNVKEVYGEIVVPLANDLPFLRLLELNAAGRYTDYSTSGGVETWKVGLTWKPVDDLRLRGVLSRDIRAPNLNELFSAGNTQSAEITDPVRNASYRATRLVVGNTNLTPEKADTTSVGVVYSPSFLPQFSASFDYYSIKLKDAITSLGAQELIDRCSRGETELCQYITRDNTGFITQVLGSSINVAQLKTRGFDIEASFRQPLGDIFDGMDGNITIRALGSHIARRTTINGGVKTEAAGQNTGDAPKWRWFGTIGYDNERVSGLVTLRTISGGVYDNLWRSGVDIDNNRIKGAAYVDLAGTYKFDIGGGVKMEAFFKVENLFDKDPPVVAATSVSALQTNVVIYDVIGRAYRAGLRFSL